MWVLFRKFSESRLESLRSFRWRRKRVSLQVCPIAIFVHRPPLFIRFGRFKLDGFASA